jgi:hypothetical protein
MFNRAPPDGLFLLCGVRPQLERLKCLPVTQMERAGSAGVQGSTFGTAENGWKLNLAGTVD